MADPATSRPNVDVVFLIGALFLFVLLGFLPEVPLFSRTASTTSGIRLYYLVAQTTFSAFVFLTGWKSVREACFSRKLVYLTLFWLLWMLLSAYSASFPSAALFRATETTVQVVFLWGLVVFFRRYSEFFTLIRYFVLAGFLLYSLFLVTGWVMFRPWEEHDYKYVFVGFGHMRHFGYYTLVVFMLAAGLLWRALHLKSRAGVMLSVFFIVSASTWLFVLGGRGPFFALLGSSIFIVVPWRRYFTRPFLLSLAFSMSAGLVISLFVSQEPYGPARLLSTLAQSESLNEFSSSRLNIWRDSVELAMQHPLTGIGPDGYHFFIAYLYPSTAHPHGIIPQALLEWGIPGALAFFFLLGWLLLIIKRWLADAESDELEWVGLYWALLALLFFSLLDGVLYHVRPTLLFLILLALLLSRLKPDRDVTSLPVRLLLPAVLPLVLVITQLHANALHAVASGQRHSAAATIDTVKRFPSVLADARLVATLADLGRLWSDEKDREELAAWYRWLEGNSSRPWYFVYLHAELLLQEGRYHDAEVLLTRFRDKTPEYFLENYDCLLHRESHLPVVK